MRNQCELSCRKEVHSTRSRRDANDLDEKKSLAQNDVDEKKSLAQNGMCVFQKMIFVHPLILRTYKVYRLLFSGYEFLT